MTNEIYYKFIKLDLSKFVAFEDNYDEDSRPLEVTTSFKFLYNFEQEEVSCEVSARIVKENKPLIEAVLISYFMITEQSANLIKENDKVILPVDLMTQFASLCYGALRGVIYAKTLGSKLDRIILPPTDISTIITHPAEF